MRTLPIFLVSALAFPALAQGIKSSYPEGSALRVETDYIEKRDGFAKRLDRKQIELVGLLEKDKAYPSWRFTSAIKAQHAQWLKYRDADCAVLGSLLGGSGAWPVAHAVRCEANLTDARLRTISAIVKCVQGQQADPKYSGPEPCLYRLSVLTNGNSRALTTQSRGPP